MAFARERGVLHRDLKPSNILVDEKGEPQVTDFGLAKLISEEDSALTLSVAMLGSPSYMAPEQADARHRDVTIPEALWRWARRSPKIAALLATLLVTLLAGFGGVLWQWRRAESSVAHLQWMEIARQAGTDDAPVALARLAQMLLETTTQKDFRRGSLGASGARVALTDGTYFARVWDVDSGALLSTIESPLPQFNFIALNAGGTRLTLAGRSIDVSVYDTICWLKISPPMRHFYEVTALAPSGDGSRVVSYGWDAQTGLAERTAIWLDTIRGAAAELFTGWKCGAAFSRLVA